MEDTLRGGRYIHNADHTSVLILVLMEDILRVERRISKLGLLQVLTLVLMEDTLRASTVTAQHGASVLILVLMEDTLRGLLMVTYQRRIARLNPCFNGRYSQRG